MILIVALYLGIVFGITAVFGKQINSTLNFRTANRKMHLYFSILGGISNLLLPLGCIVLCFMSRGIGVGGVFIITMLVGSFLAGFVVRTYLLRQIVALLGVPSGLIFFFLAL